MVAQILILIKKIMKNFSLIALFFFVINSYSRVAVLDSIPFSTQTSLLVFKGKLNGVEVNFAFDTGASLGVLNSKNVFRAKIINSGNRAVTDSNEKSSRVGQGQINVMSIGAFDFNEVKSVITDMPFLYCNDLYLLGGDVINQLNWKFDFMKKMIYISNLAFDQPQNSYSIPIKIKNNRHFADITLKGKTIKKCLIDMGYNGVFEGVSDDDVLSDLYDFYKQKNMVVESQNFSMGLTSMSVANETHNFMASNFSIGDFQVPNIKVLTKQNSENKLGLGFFSSSAKLLVMNPKEKIYYIVKRDIVSIPNQIMDADFMFQENKLIIVGKSLNDESTAKALAVGEEILSINGKDASSFGNQCGFFKWRYDNLSEATFEIIKKNGEKVIMKKQVLKAE
jgi:hypothetical protein